MKQKAGSLTGGILLITGSCVGAGMLGLPIVSGLAGFFPALCMFFLAFLFMTFTGLLVVEATVWFPKQVNFFSIVGHSLGKGGRLCCWILYLFLFYALLVAYISASGSLFSSFLQNVSEVSLPAWMGSLFFVLLFGSIVYKGTRQVDLWNRFLMVGKILFFLALVGVGVRFIKPTLLLRTEGSLALFSLPILITSFGFHNMIPSLTSYLGGDLVRVKKAIWGGGILAFLIYLVWEILVLGIVPFENLLASYQLDQEGSQALASSISSNSLQFFAQGLAFFAILTSFLAQALSFVHFLADGFKISHEKKESLGLCFLALCPPLVLALFYPKLFFKALDFAGGICAVLLFGVIPALTVWIGRYHKKSSTTYTLKGGKVLLISILAFSLFIFCFEVLILLGLIDTSGLI